MLHSFGICYADNVERSHSFALRDAQFFIAVRIEVVENIIPEGLIGEVGGIDGHIGRMALLRRQERRSHKKHVS